MDSEIRTSIEAIHAGPAGFVLVCTGGGARAVEWLLEVPGASASVLEALVPYSRGALAALLGGEPDRSTSPETACWMAERAFERARRWAEAETRPVLGVACTAALVTNRPKRGDHRVVIAIRERESVTTSSLTLVKGARDRDGEEEIASRLLLRALCEACGVAPRFGLELWPEETVAVERQERLSPIARLLRGDLASLLVLADGELRPAERPDAVLFPGAFNPMHQGHRQLAAVVSRLLGRPVVYEISVENVDKPLLAEAELRRRLRQFVGLAPVILTRAPTFRRKAELFPGTTFVIGYDTLERLFAPRYYGSEEAMRAALAEMRDLGAQFIVAGRHHADQFRTLTDFPIPEELRSLFRLVPPEQFRSDLSSTALRAARQQRPRPPR